MKNRIKCDMCGKEIERYPSQVKRHNFCSRKCLAEFSGRQTNPERYKEFRDYENISKNMSLMNKRLNPMRMNFAVRAKLSMAKRGTGAGKSYAKSFGIHTHRVVAERMIGRKLRPEEVVHHIDGNRRNNSPKNLMVFENQAEHVKWHAANEGGDAL